MRYVAGLILLLIVWPLLIVFDLATACLFVTLFIWADQDGPCGVKAAMRVTELVFR